MLIAWDVLYYYWVEHVNGEILYHYVPVLSFTGLMVYVPLNPAALITKACLVF